MPSPNPESNRRTLAWLTLAAILAAWAFGAAARVAWHDRDDANVARLDGQPMLVTPDAFYYASGVQQTLTDAHAANPRVPDASDNIIIAFASFISTAFGIPIATACYWAPVVLAPLVAIPLILLGLLFGHLLSGFIAALIAVLGFQFWPRTIPGYFDTDCVTVAYVLTVHLVCIATFVHASTRFVALAGLFAALSVWVHPGSERIIIVLLLALVGYTLVFARRHPHGYRIAVALALGLAPWPLWVRITLIVALELTLSFVPLSPLLERLRRIPRPVGIAALGAALGAVVLFSPAWQRVLLLLGLGPSDSLGLVPGLEFQRVASFVVEQRGLTFTELATLTAGHPVLLLTGLAGFLLLCWRQRPALLLAPVLVLGTAIAITSVRYTIFGAPIVALGNGILAVSLAHALTRRLTVSRAAIVSRGISLVVALLLATPAFATALDRAANHPRVSYLLPPEATLLKHVKPIVKPGDFMLSWWDQAYPVWYYTGGRSLVDGTKHDEDLWLMAEILLSPSQRGSATLARMAVEHQVLQPPLSPVIDDILAAWQKDGGTASDFVPAIREGRAKVPARTRDIFIYLPLRLFENFGSMLTMRAVAGLLPADELNAERIFSATPILRKPDASGASSASAWTFDRKRKVVVHASGHTVPVHTVHSAWGPPAINGTFAVEDELLNPNGRVWVIEHRHRNLRFIMDRQLHASVYTQLVLLNRPDPEWFQTIRIMPGGAVYRVRPDSTTRPD